MRTRFIFSLFYLFVFNSFAGEFPVLGTKENALGMSNSTYKSTNTQNPAFFSHYEKKVIQAYSQYHFSGVPILQLSFLSPLRQGKVLQTSIASFATDFYKDQHFSLAYGQKIGDKLALGTSLMARFIQIPHYYQYHFWQISVGGVYQVNPQLKVSFVGKTQLLSDVQQEREAQKIANNDLKIGVLYHQKKWQMMAELHQIPTYPLIFKMGLDYALYENFSIQTGWNTAQHWGMGMQVKANAYTIGMACQYQQLRGFVPHFSCEYEF